MNYSEAVRLAKGGKEEGYTFLYESTYKEKYYLALKYMKNEEAARDVLQDAYIRAFSKLETLNDPESFPAWLGMIVANTAKNALMKRNPMLFSDVAVDEEGESFEYQIEDDNPEIQPETAYTRQETQELVHELLDGLSEEQRMCILMFHIEGIPIKEIAETLGCSENTVKSRLNYGRKNLKAKAEELQKKGYKLYGIAPLPLLLYLLRTDGAYTAADKAYASAAEVMEHKILEGVSAGTRTAGAVKAGLLHTAAGKAVAVVAGVCVIGGGSFGAYQLINSGHTSQPAEQTVQEQPLQEPDADKTEEETVEQEPEVIDIKDEDYPELIAGNLTREELEYVLAYGPDEIPQEGFTGADQSETAMVLSSLCLGSEESPIEFYGSDGNGEYAYSLEDINRLFSSFSALQFTEENDSDSEYGIHVDGGVLSYVPPTMSYTSSADITSAVCTEEEMEIRYTYARDYADPAGEDIRTGRIAVLRPDENGMYRIESIEEADQIADVERPDEETGQNSPGSDQSSAGESMQDPGTVRKAYESALQSAGAREPGFDFPAAGDAAESYGYFLCDMNGDGVKELVIGAMFPEQVFYIYDCRVYTVSSDGSAQPAGEDFVTMALFIPSDGNGLFTYAFSRGNGQVDISRLTLSGTSLESAPEYQFTMGSEEDQKFSAENTKPEWKDISDLSGLDGLS